MSNNSSASFASVASIDIKKERREKLDRTRSNEMVHEIVYETVNICEPERGVEYVECLFAWRRR